MPRNTAQQLYDVGYVVYGGEREGRREGEEEGAGKRKKDAKKKKKKRKRKEKKGKDKEVGELIERGGQMKCR